MADVADVADVAGVADVADVADGELRGVLRGAGGGTGIVEAVPAAHIRRLVGVYDADGTIRGELAYVVGSMLGRTHCSLCDITHGALRERADWRRCRDAGPVPFETFHRNDQPEAVRALLAGSYPAVAAETAGGWVLLLGRKELETCDASPQALMAALESSAARLGLVWEADG